ncbi:uncharacterized protein LTR77_003901 [Saxophila tyrrhenica]|uniref:non-specific serine/threonine protein kinase n=1 Tax=Saxophila tyrrhenica TaxID=1690608 RepID=A0AAV9PF56_9PEZI|nr:hypothetical protein LTR77_003901 [Saxophila tyrrhenica]
MVSTVLMDTAEQSAAAAAAAREIQECIDHFYDDNEPGTMDPTRLAPESIDHEKKQKAVQDARDMYQYIVQNCERANSPVPAFDFIELIGKGASGRVYKCRDRRTNSLVAIKIVNTDDVDYTNNTLDKDDTIRDFIKEVNTLQQLKDARAKNINMIREAFDLQTQLWIVCDYCTGGSVRTLMRAQPPSKPGLEEKFIIPIARELALAIKNVHDIGVIHRDIKATNVYVTESGEIQLGDFGIVGVLEDEGNKRRTIIGTPHYMPLEMLPPDSSFEGNQAPQAYGREVDVWSYGCTIFEIATGVPPNSRTHPELLTTVLDRAPRLEGGDYPQELRDFVAFLLQSNPEERPTADEIVKHPYVAGTQKKYPTESLVDLITRFKSWEYSGGYRQSLFMAGGAPPVPGSSESPVTQGEEDYDDWNFSTTDTFNADFGRRYSRMMDLSEDTPDLSLDTSASTKLPPIQTENLTPFDKMQQEISAGRGERSLQRLWNADTSEYKLHDALDEQDDLPLRRMTAGAPTRESQVIIDLDEVGDLDAAAPTLSFDFGDVPTVKAARARNSRYESMNEDDEETDFEPSYTDEDRERRATMEWTFPTAKRATMDWTFPSHEPYEPENPVDLQMSLPPIGDADGEMAPGFRPQLKHTATMPIGDFSDFQDFVHSQHTTPASASPIRNSTASMIDLNMSFVDASDIPPRPGTATSTTGSTMTDMTSGNPFDLEEDPAQKAEDQKRFSHHKQWQSEGGGRRTSHRQSRRSIPMHARGSSLSSSTDDDDAYTYQYNRSLSARMGHQLNGSADSSTIDMNAWPSFDSTSGFSEVPGYHDELDETALAPRTIDFPRSAAPAPGVLVEGADLALVEAELGRLLEDLEVGLADIGEALQARGEALGGAEGSGDESEF